MERSETFESFKVIRTQSEKNLNAVLTETARKHFIVSRVLPKWKTHTNYKKNTFFC